MDSNLKEKLAEIKDFLENNIKFPNKNNINIPNENNIKIPNIKFFSKGIIL